MNFIRLILFSEDCLSEIVSLGFLLSFSLYLLSAVSQNNKNFGNQLLQKFAKIKMIGVTASILEGKTIVNLVNKLCGLL